MKQSNSVDPLFLDLQQILVLIMWAVQHFQSLTLMSVVATFEIII